ncbi:hypothetical protein [Pseudomonas sp. Irchel 3A7]|uniref:hypothetical protein n=1 Tax=Pseudomonas sp. Irchel 3A7 TaxID=2008913 RepID=UPI0011405BD7|nr:hypothetical protein [Pseudomonas sp. Irchel 3A7]
MDFRASARPLKVKDDIAGFVFAMHSLIGRDAYVVMPEAIFYGVDIHWVRGRKTRPRRRNLSLKAGKITKAVLLEFLSESQHSNLLWSRVIGKFDGEFSIVVNRVRQSRILAKG